MSEEQAIYGLIVTAQEQQKIAGDQLATLGELKTTIRQAGDAVQAMRLAGDASAAVIEKATRIAVDKALQDVLERVSDKARSSIVDAIKPAISALQAVSGDAVGAGQELRDSISWVGWKWFAVCVAAAFGLFTAMMLGVVLLVPSARDLAALRAEKADLEASVAALERRGGRVQLTNCGDKKRLCALIDPEQFNSNGTVKQFGEKDEHWMILKGY